jgi:HK97 family phage major capsid protein
MDEAKLEELRHRRSHLVTDMRGISDKAEAENRNLTAEEQQEFDRREADFEALTERIKRSEKIGGLTPTMTRSDAVTEEEEEAVATRTQILESDRYQTAFDAYMRGQDLDAEQRSTLNTATDADGGYAVPEEWGGLIEPLREAGTIRTLAEVVQTGGAGPLHFPRVSAAATAPVITAEEASIADDGEAFDEVILGAYKYAKIQKASEEMVQDPLFNVAEFVARRTGFDIGLAQNAHFVNGTGTGQPQGLFAGATVGKTAASPSAITLDEVIDTFYSVSAPYRANGVFIANDATHASLRKLKDTAGQYLWQPTVQDGQPDRFIGKPIYADPSVLTIATARRVLGFGDVSRAYTIRDAGGVGVKFLDQTYAGTDQVAWRVKLRSDGKIVDANAFKVLLTA